MTELMTSEERREACKELLLQDHEWDYAQWLQELTMHSLVNVEDLLGPDTSADPMRRLVQPIADIGYPNAETWRDAIEDVSAFFDVLPISPRFNEGLLYGMYGVTPDEVALEHRSQWLHCLVAELNAFAARSDVKQLGGGENALLRIARLAASRHAVDFGEGEVDLESMALLGGVTEGRIRNILSDPNSPLERGPGGAIKAMSAARWLQKKKGFLTSVWHAEETSVHTSDEGVSIAPEKVIFVPVARDGSMFTPDLIRNGAYRIGAKGEEEDINDFAAALTRLNSMPVPRWRRPNEQNHWGIVSGVAWQRIEKV
ncbi:hypothetical protein [Roseovarius confluentis]|uniref:hypothetical protein n=1 Tax=Roseovarius confluentis TaxID=1852027 RepID=UPI003BAB78E0